MPTGPCRVTHCACLLLAILQVACARTDASHLPAPVAAAQVSQHVREQDLVTVTLEPEAEARIGVETTPAIRQLVATRRTLAGEVIAPAADASAATRYAAAPSMDPAQLATAQIEADAAVERADVALRVSRQRETRVQRLFERGLESAGARDDARAATLTAQATLQAARRQRALLGDSVMSERTPSRVWVRAAIYVGDLERIDRTSPARVVALGPGSRSRKAVPVAAPPTASARSGAAFVFYEVDNADGALNMGERVEVDVPSRETEPALTVPEAALLYDSHGGEWVYERTAEHVYTRRRVSVRTVTDGVVVLDRGATDGAQIVAQGAAELLGVEFHINH